MKDYGHAPVALADRPPQVVTLSEFQSAAALESAVLVETGSESAAPEEPLIDPPSTTEDLLQYFLAIESSRQEMEAYNQYLITVVQQAAQGRLEAESAARARSELLASMSRELRTPLNGVIGMTSALLARQLGEPERDYVETIHQAGEAMRITLDDVLDFAKIEAGKLRLEPAAFELAGFVADTLQIVQSAASQKPLQVLVSQDARLPEWVRGDSARIRQILMHLLSNAIKFSNAGNIEVRIRLQSIDQDECELLLSVKDEGSGIAGERLAKLFEPFSKAEDFTARSYAGLGLGLAISKGLAELMGGQIGVSSREGEGSLFWFTVRILVAQEPVGLIETEQFAAASPAGSQNARILLVDANRINQKVALLMLNNLGYAADVALNGSDALLAMERVHYDLILMDCVTSEIDGFGATRRLRGLAGHAHSIPVIALTASALEDDRLACLSAGMNDFISLPVCEADLAAKLGFWLSPERAVPELGVSD